MSGTIHRPASESDVAEVVAHAFGSRTGLEIRGGGSKRGMAGAIDAAAAVETSGLRGISLYEPSELVIGAAAGTPLRELTEALDAKGQMLAFEPPDLTALLRLEGREATVGGLVSANLSGPRRVVAGACRDGLIGIRFVNGRGEAIKSGGRVMKNVTGYDLTKLVAGAWGTLGVVTQAIFKVVPKPEATGSLAWSNLSDEDAVALMSAALGSPYEVSAAAHRSTSAGKGARTVLRLENFARSVSYRGDRLARELARFGPCDRLDAGESEGWWRNVREVRDLVPLSGAVWRVSVAPSKACAVARAVRLATDARVAYDWGGGLVWLVVPEDMLAARSIADAVLVAGGHAMAVRCSEAHRSEVAALRRKSEPLAALTGRVKAAFDPEGILNPDGFGVTGRNGRR